VFIKSWICLVAVQDRNYQRKRQKVEKFIKKYRRVDHSVILNNVDIDYDTLMKILSDLRREGRITWILAFGNMW